MSAAVTWPAPPAVSPWEFLTLRTVPATSPAPRPKVTRRPARLPEEMRGVALRYKTWFTPDITEMPGGPVPAGLTTHVYIEPDALDLSLAEIAEGSASFAFLSAHDGRQQLASSWDGCLKLWRAGNRLRFRISGHNDAGRLVLYAVRAVPHRELSIGLQTIKGTRWRAGDELFFLVRRARIIEVSLVPAGACPGCELLA